MGEYRIFMLFIVVTGLTRRLVEADSAYEAIQAFLNDRIMYRHVQIDPLNIRAQEATDAEIAMFAPWKNRSVPGPDQLALQLDDARERGKSSSKMKDHA